MWILLVAVLQVDLGLLKGWCGLSSCPNPLCHPTSSNESWNPFQVWAGPRSKNIHGCSGSRAGVHFATTPHWGDTCLIPSVVRFIAWTAEDGGSWLGWGMHVLVKSTVVDDISVLPGAPLPACAFPVAAGDCPTPSHSTCWIVEGVSASTRHTSGNHWARRDVGVKLDMTEIIPLRRMVTPRRSGVG